MSGAFGFESTTDDVLRGRDLSGQLAVITGVSAGLGVETARALAAHGARVIGTVRDLAKGRAATAGIDIELLEMDLASLASVRACADALLERGDPIDLLICNAGVMATPEGRTADGFETQFGTNHLGHFVFANRVAPLLRRGSRVVMLSSAGHRFADVDLDDPNFERTPYQEWTAYGRAKTANILFAVEFDRRHRDRGVRAIAVHPGAIETELGRHVKPEVMAALRSTAPASEDAPPPMPWKSIPQGAATTLWAAVVADADAVGGLYCEDCHLAEINNERGAPGGVQSYALDPERAKALWTRSEEMTGERF